MTLARGPPTDLGGQAGGLEGVPQDVDAAVEVQDDMAGFDAGDGDLGGADSAECAGGHGHVAGQRLRRCQLPELSPQLADVAFGREGGLPQDCVEVVSLFDAHGGSPVAWSPPGRTPGGLPMSNPLLKRSGEPGHDKAGRQAGEEASPDHGDSRHDRPSGNAPASRARSRQ